MSAPRPSPHSMSREAMARTKAAAAAMPAPVVTAPLVVRDSGRGLLHLVNSATGEICGVATNADLLGRTRNFFA